MVHAVFLLNKCHLVWYCDSIQEHSFQVWLKLIIFGVWTYQFYGSTWTVFIIQLHKVLICLGRHDCCYLKLNNVKLNITVQMPSLKRTFLFFLRIFPRKLTAQENQSDFFPAFILLLARLTWHAFLAVQPRVH